MAIAITAMSQRTGFDFIRDAQATGLTLTEIGSILDMREEGAGTCEHVIELLQRHLADLDEHIKELHCTRDQLASMATRARQLDPADCTDPHRCQTIAPPSEAGSVVRTEHLHASPHRHAEH